MLRIERASAEGPFGTIVSEPPGLSCSQPPCSATFPFGTSIRLKALTPHEGGVGFAGWSGGCTGLDVCDVSLGSDLVVSARFGAANIAFVSSATLAGTFGSLAVADGLCQDLAARAGLPGSFRAWLNTSQNSEMDRIAGARGWVRTDGKPIVDGVEQLIEGRMYYPIRLDEAGRDTSTEVWTGSQGWGIGGPLSCNDWTSTASTAYEDTFGGVADSRLVGSNLDYIGAVACSTSMPVFCFGVDRNVAIAPEPRSGRLAFLTSATFAPGGGLSAADALCQAEASSAGLPGSYRAVLATSTASAASRFNLLEPAWVRPDGIPITNAAADFFQQELWLSAPNLTPDGQYLGDYGIWSGGSSLTRPGTPGDTCSNWTSTQGTTLPGRSGLSAPSGFYYYLFTEDCSGTANRLSCLQE